MLDNSPQTNINLLLLTTNEKELLVSQAVFRLQDCYFSLNDVYREIGFCPGKSWSSKEEIIPPILIRRVFRNIGVCSRSSRNTKAGTARYYFPGGMSLNYGEV